MDAVAGAETEAIVMQARTGISESTLSRWRTGVATPTAPLAVQFARGYNVHPVAALQALGLISAEEAQMIPPSEVEVVRNAAPEVLTNELLNRVRRTHEVAPGDVAQPGSRELPDLVAPVRLPTAAKRAPSAGIALRDAQDSDAENGGA